jgi:hypothetical protein
VGFLLLVEMVEKSWNRLENWILEWGEVIQDRKMARNH